MTGPAERRTSPPRAGEDGATARWRAERRRLVRTHHPDAGGSATALAAALAAHDRLRPGAAPAHDRVVVEVLPGRRTRVRRRLRRVVALARTRLPLGPPAPRRDLR